MDTSFDTLIRERRSIRSYDWVIVFMVASKAIRLTRIRFDVSSKRLTSARLRGISKWLFVFMFIL